MDDVELLNFILLLTTNNWKTMMYIIVLVYYPMCNLKMLCYRYTAKAIC